MASSLFPAVMTTELQLLGFAVALLVVLLSVLILDYRSKPAAVRDRKLRLPPGPPRLPIIGNLHQLGELPHRSLRKMADKHGPLLYLQLGTVPTVIACSVDTATEVLKTQDLSFCDRPPVIAADKFAYGGRDIAFSPYNEHWRQAKKIAVVELFTSKRVQSFRPAREDEVAIMVRTIARLSSEKKPVNLGEMFICLFNNIIGREVFSRRISDDDGDCGRSANHDLIQEMSSLLGGFCAGDFFPSLEWLNVLTGWQNRLDKNFAAMDEFLEREVDAHIAAAGARDSDHADFCDILLGLQKDPSLGIPITKTHIKAILMNMFLGGTETAASTLEWGMADLARTPRVMKKAQEEVWTVVGKEKGKVEESDLPNLPYMRMVLKEIFRLHPLSILPRACRERCKIGGYDIPAGTTVFVNAWAISRDPGCFESPEEFRPERFEGSSLDYKGQHMQILPFGAGRRMCPGQTLGSVGLELALSNLLYCFRWELPEGEKEVDMSDTFGLAIHKKEPLLLKATPLYATNVDA